jgi:hypothetical protein
MKLPSQNRHIVMMKEYNERQEIFSTITEFGLSGNKCGVKVERERIGSAKRETR